MTLQEALPSAVAPHPSSTSRGLKNILLRGMHGIGDNIHQRGILRWLLRQNVYSIYLEASAHSIYWDLVEKYGLKIVRKETLLTFQKKNLEREAHLFWKGALPKDKEVWTIWYRKEDVNGMGSVLGAMCKHVHVPPDEVDFRLPIHPLWKDVADKLIAKWKPTKPIMIYRPLIKRVEWGGCDARNPD